MNPKKILMLALAVSAALCILCVGKSNVAGTTETGNAGSRVALSGTIVDNEGNPLSSARVRLLPDDFNPVAPVVLSDSLIGYSESDGAFTIRTAFAGDFVLSVCHQKTGLRKLVFDISVDTDTDIGEIELIEPQSMVVDVQDALVPGSSVYIPGTLYKAALNEDGLAKIDSVAARYVDIGYYDEKKDSVIATYENVRVRDTVEVSSCSENTGSGSATFTISF